MKHIKYNKKISIGLAIGVFVLIVGTLISNIILHPFNDNSYSIFSTIDECENLIAGELPNAKITRYDNSSKDINSKDLSVEKFFGVDYKLKELEYEFFAYEFSNSDEALQYYINVTEKNSYAKNPPTMYKEEQKLFSASMGMTSYQLVVIHENRAYQITAPKRYEDEINKLLADKFSVKI